MSLCTNGFSFIHEVLKYILMKYELMTVHTTPRARVIANPFKETDDTLYRMIATNRVVAFASRIGSAELLKESRRGVLVLPSSSLSLSITMMFASTAIPIVKIIPAKPAIVSEAPITDSAITISDAFTMSVKIAKRPRARYR